MLAERVEIDYPFPRVLLGQAELRISPSVATLWLSSYTEQERPWSGASPPMAIFSS